MCYTDAHDYAQRMISAHKDGDVTSEQLAAELDYQWIEEGWKPQVREEWTAAGVLPTPAPAAPVIRVEFVEEEPEMAPVA